LCWPGGVVAYGSYSTPSKRMSEEYNENDEKNFHGEEIYFLIYYLMFCDLIDF
jgi:hypothetical protein